MKKERIRNFIIDVLIVLIGSALVGAGIALFTAPNRIAPGGVSGLATAVSSLLGGKISIGILSLIFNVPIVILGLKKLGLRPILTTLFATVLLSGFIDLFAAVFPVYTANTLMAALVGGVLCGAGTGILFVRGTSTGGTDLLSLVLKVYFPSMEVGKLLLLVDGLVVLFAVLIFKDIEVALYSIVAIFASSKTVDAIVEGVEYGKVIYIITDKGEQIRQTLLTETKRGVTVVPVKGGYTGGEKTMLMIVTGRFEFSKTIRIVTELDKQAFIITTNATEVHGEGFKPID